MVYSIFCFGCSRPSETSTNEQKPSNENITSTSEEQTSDDGTIEEIQSASESSTEASAEASALEFSLNDDKTGYIVTGIGNYMDKDVIIPDNYNALPVVSIGKTAFLNCTSLESITIPNSVTCIGVGAFNGCTSLSKITIPDSVTTIGYYAFYECTSLSDITIPNSVTTIGHEAFFGCTSLTSIAIPDSVESIGYLAFQECSSLTDVTFINTSGWSCEQVPGWTIYGTQDIEVFLTSEALSDSSSAFNLLKEYEFWNWKRK